MDNTFISTELFKHLMEGKALGLTKREYFAGLAMQGLISGNYQFGSANAVTHRATMAKEACLYADALLSALETEPKP